jgi:hypothetical protein
VEKVDLKKTLPRYTAVRGRFDLIEVPPARYLAIDGQGDPNTAPAYAEALATLYPVAYALKFAARRALGRDFVVMPLEALWWADDMAAFTTARDKAGWSWTAMIHVPDEVGDDLVAEAAAAKPGAPAIAALRVLALAEGECVQTLHVGPYDDEGPVLARLHDEIIPARGRRMTGRHHEIYLGDPRRTAPERRKTILRQPVTRA